MAQPQERIIVFEPNGGLCAYRTPEAAMGHYKSIGWLDQLEFFDARGRRLRRVAGSSSELEEDSEQDHSAHIRERVRQSLAEAHERLRRERERTADAGKLRGISESLREISTFLKDEGEEGLAFHQLVEKLTTLLRETPEAYEAPRELPAAGPRGWPHPFGTPWSHWATAAHHR